MAVVAWRWSGIASECESLKLEVPATPILDASYALAEPPVAPQLEKTAATARHRRKGSRMTRETTTRRTCPKQGRSVIALGVKALPPSYLSYPHHRPHRHRHLLATRPDPLHRRRHPSPPNAPHPPLPFPPSPTATSIYRKANSAILNERFRRSPFTAKWSSDGMLADAGCSSTVTRRARASRGRKASRGWSRPTAMGSHPIPLYPGKNGGSAGLIFRPGITKLECGKPVDSVGTCQVWGGWCKHSRIHLPWTEANDKMCAWRVADFGPQLQRLTAYQEKGGLSDQYNEIIVSSKWWLAHNPDMVEAIFGDRKAHAAFLSEFGLTEATHPFVWLDRGDWTNPIR